VVGAVVAVGAIKVLYPAVTPAEAANVVLPHDMDGSRTSPPGPGPETSRERS